MEELIKRLERVIQTGAPDKDGMHPISAETVLEVVRGLSEHGTDLAEVGTDCISRQQAIDALCNDYCGGHQDCKYYPKCENLKPIQQLPPAEPKRGKWIHHPEIGWGETWLCDQCGEKTSSTVMGKPRANFCPNCGADMRGEYDG